MRRQAEAQETRTMGNPLTDVDGGAAFPSAPHQARMNDSGVLEPFGFEGMSLRDWFAGQALAGILAGPCSRQGVPATEWFDAPRKAYELADAMLRAGAKEGK